MPTLNYENAGALVEYDYLQGTVTAVYPVDDTADVSGGCGSLSGIPIFYHCNPESKRRDNGAIEGSAVGFKVGDSVVVLKAMGDGPASRLASDEVTTLSGPDRGADGSAYYIIGHYDGVKRCSKEYLMVSGKYNPEYADNPIWSFIWDIPADNYATDVFKMDGENKTIISPSEYPIKDGPSILSPWASGREYLFTDIGVADSENSFYAPSYSRVGDIVYVAGETGRCTTVSSIKDGRLKVADISKLGTGYCSISPAISMVGREVEWWDYEPYNATFDFGSPGIIDGRGYSTQPEFIGYDYYNGEWWAWDLNAKLKIGHRALGGSRELLPSDETSSFLYRLVLTHDGSTHTGGYIENTFKSRTVTRISSGNVIPGFNTVKGAGGGDRASIIPRYTDPLNYYYDHAGPFDSACWMDVSNPNPLIGSIRYVDSISNGGCFPFGGANTYKEALGSFSARSLNYDVQFYAHLDWPENVYAQCRPHNGIHSTPTLGRSSRLEDAIKNLISVVESNFPVTGLSYWTTIEGLHYSEVRT